MQFLLESAPHQCLIGGLNNVTVRVKVKKSEFIKYLSPVAWTHVNFQGRYEFLSSHETIDIDSWLQGLLISEDDFKSG